MLIGHTIAYLIALPVADDRASVLDVSGHGYWSSATLLAMVLFSWAVATHVREHFQAGRNHAGPPSTRGLGRRLAVAQVVLFVLLELTERAVSGEQLTSLEDHHLLLIGVITQVVVAAGLANLCSWLARAASRLGRRLSADLEPISSTAVLWSAIATHATSAVPASPRTSRGPPWSPSFSF